MNRLFLALFAFLLLAAGCADPAGDAEAEADAMAEQHQDDTPEATVLVQEPRYPVNAYGVEYTLADEADQAFIGYMAVPTRPDSIAGELGLDLAPGDTTLPAVILIHEWWGLNENVQAAARRLAGEGFRVLAVDLYGRQVAATPQEAQMIMQQTLQDGEAVDANLRAAYDFLTERYEAPRVGIMGWCFGGGMALRGAVNMPSALDAAVIYYGRVSGYEDDQLAALEMPVLGIFGADDESIPLEDVRAFEETLDAVGTEATIEIYEGAGHAFANPSGQNFVEDAAADAWDKTTAFLREQLYDGM
ncbi:MAG: dienelactone hydrolase family protein [Rhodothermales bacterium]|nr:dienelactone hydrolase family protein [Rhodothermales bacterium]